MKRILLFVLLFTSFSLISPRFWDVIFGDIHKVPLHQVANYITDRIIVNFVNKFGYKPSNNQVGFLFKRATDRLYLTKEQIDAIEVEVNQVINNYSGRGRDYSRRDKKITHSQLDDYIENYIKHKLRITYDPKNIDGYFFVFDNIKRKVERRAYAGTTNDGINVVEYLYWSNIIDRIIEEEIPSLRF